MRKYLCMTVLICSCFTTGCGTYASLQHRGFSDPIIFGGVRIDLLSIKHKSQQNEWLKKQKLYNPYIDIPFSVFPDLFLLPYTIPYSIVKY